MPVLIPIYMFCGLPVTVRALPMLDESAIAARYGIGFILSAYAAETAIGVISKHTVSFTNRAERSAEEHITPYIWAGEIA